MTQTDRSTGLVGNTGVKQPVRVATTVNITLTGEQIIDGVAVVTGDRVLVKNQTSGIDNGVYVVDSGDWERARDFDGLYDVVQGSLVHVVSGSQALSWWEVSTANPVIGTSVLAFSYTLVNSSATVSFIQSGTGAVATTAQDQLRKIVFRSDYDTLGHYNAAKAASSARVFLDQHQDTNYVTGDGSADGALNIYSQITSSHDIVLAAAGAADIHVGNLTGGTGVFFIDTNIKVAPWGNGSRGHGLQILQNDNSTSIEFPSSGGIIEVSATIRGANGANKDLIFRNGAAAGQWFFKKSDNSAAIMTLSDIGVAKFGPTPSFVINPDTDAARIQGGGSGSNIIFYPTQGGTGTGGAFKVSNNKTDEQIHFQVLATAGIAAANHIQITGAATGANPKINASAENILFGTGAAIATTATAGYVMFPSCAGTPTGVPTGQGAGNIPMIFDTTGVKLWFYTGGAWKGVVVA